MAISQRCYRVNPTVILIEWGREVRWTLTQSGRRAAACHVRRTLAFRNWHTSIHTHIQSTHHHHHHHHHHHSQQHWHDLILISTTLTHTALMRRSQHSQECKDPRRQCFCDSWPFDPKINGCPGLNLRTVYVKSGDPGCISFFEISCEKQGDTQTNRGKNRTPLDCHQHYHSSLKSVNSTVCRPWPSVHSQHVQTTGEGRVGKDSS